MSYRQLDKETFFKEECSISKHFKSGTNMKIGEAKKFFNEGKALLEKGEDFEALENFNSVSCLYLLSSGSRNSWDHLFEGRQQK